MSSSTAEGLTSLTPSVSWRTSSRVSNRAALPVITEERWVTTTETRSMTVAPVISAL